MGLFPAKERETILGLLEKSLVFLTHDNIEQVLREEHWLSSAWNLANLYLGSLGSKCLNGKPSYLVGLSKETTCYVSTERSGCQARTALTRMSSSTSWPRP